VLSGYSKFFAGTFYYLLSVDNHGEMSNNFYFAITAAMIIAMSEALLVWGLSLMWFDGALMARKELTIGMVCTLLLINCTLFLRRGKYVEIVNRYESNRRRLTWMSVGIHTMTLVCS
jgi:hypothetical protein